MLSTQTSRSKLNRSFDEFKGVMFRPKVSEGLVACVDASFAGDWNVLGSAEATSVMSRTGFVTKCMGCLVFWVSKLQTEIALSTTEAEHIALSHSMREILPFIKLIKELH